MKSSSVVSEEMIEWDFMELHRVLLLGRCCPRLCELSRADVLSWLGHVSLDRFRRIRAIACHKSSGEPRPCGVGAAFDGCKPCGFDWETCRGVQVGDEGRYTG